MGYCYSLYTPDLKQRKTGKFVVCDKLFLSNDDSFKDITKNIIGFMRILILENIYQISTV